MKIGLFGGSFNPVHNSHLLIIKKVLERSLVDEVWIIPCKNHAFNKSLSSVKDRMKMLSLAIKGEKNVKISEVEINSDGVNYTYDTVKKLKELYPSNSFYFIAGGDIKEDVHKWHRGKELLKEIKFIFLDRTDISSTLIRRKIEKNEPIKNLVPKEVEEYIIKNKLYVKT